jgi:Aldehyde dehydrogenase family
VIPSDHARYLCTYYEADETTVARAIDGAIAAKAQWEAMPWADRAAIFLKAADLISKKYRYRLIAATMLGQGKNVWQAEIDAAAEVSAPLSGMCEPGCLTSICSLASRLFPLWREVCRRALLSATTAKLWRCMEVRVLSPSKPYSPNPQLVASSTALLKASSSRCHHSTLPPSAVIFLAVRISNSPS